MRLCFVLILLVSAASAVPAFAQSSPKAAMLEQTAWAALDARKIAEAEAAFKEAIALDPKNPRLRLGIGMIAFLQRRDADAKQALEYALQLDPRFSRARAQLAHVIRRMGDLLGAIREYERVVSELPNDKAARETLERWQRELE